MSPIRNSQLIATALQWQDRGHEPLLVTVLKTWGSAPRQAGSMMIMGSHGEFFGSVSGGCVEDDLMERYAFFYNHVREMPKVVKYGGDKGESGVRLPCGGELHLLIESLTPVSKWHELIDILQQGDSRIRLVDTKTGEIKLIPGEKQASFFFRDDVMHQPFGHDWQMLLIGAGSLSQHVARLGLSLNYHVMVCDPRDPQAPGFEEVVQWVCTMPDEAVKALRNPQRSLVLALSHEPQLDDMALMEALRQDFFYVGALGSTASSAARRERLRQLQLEEWQIRRLHAPIGFPLGGRSPGEIALAIMAQVTALRNNVIMTRLEYET